MSVSSSPATVSGATAKKSFRVLVSPVIFVRSSPDRACVWKDNDRRWRWVRSSRRRVVGEFDPIREVMESWP